MYAEINGCSYTKLAEINLQIISKSNEVVRVKDKLATNYANRIRGRPRDKMTFLQKGWGTLADML